MTAMIRKTVMTFAVLVAFVMVGFLGALANDSRIHYIACSDACLRDGSKIYQQVKDICICADMSMMRRGPVSCVFRKVP